MPAPLTTTSTPDLWHAAPTPASGKRVGAFFDMDRTLLRINSGSAWIRHMRRRGEITLKQALRAALWMARYRLALIDLDAVAEIAAMDLHGQVESELAQKTRAWMHEEIFQQVAPLAVRAVEKHREAGHVMVILTSSTPYLTQPLAEYLGIDHILCTQLVVENGRFVGTHVRPACFGGGKVVWAERFAEEHGVDLDASWFYTDSYSDLPMLERVPRKVIVNPDRRLQRHARRAGWPVENW